MPWPRTLFCTRFDISVFDGFDISVFDGFVGTMPRWDVCSQGVCAFVCTCPYTCLYMADMKAVDARLDNRTDACLTHERGKPHYLPQLPPLIDLPPAYFAPLPPYRSIATLPLHCHPTAPLPPYRSTATLPPTEPNQALDILPTAQLCPLLLCVRSMTRPALSVRCRCVGLPPLTALYCTALCSLLFAHAHWSKC